MGCPFFLNSADDSFCVFGAGGGGAVALDGKGTRCHGVLQPLGFVASADVPQQHGGGL